MKNTNAKKYRLSLILTLLLALVFGLEAYASPKLNIFVEDKSVVFNQKSGYPFVDANSRTQVPLRSVAEASGATVSWDANKRMAIVKNKYATLEIPIGVPKIYKNGYPMYNDTSAILKDGRTYLPIRKVLELMNYEVVWVDNPPGIYAYKQDDTYAITKATKLPEKYDLRKVGRLGPIRDQFQSMDCWAFATSNSLQSKLLPGENITFSPRHMSEHSMASAVYGDGGGTQDIAAAYYLNWIGPVKEEDYPFEGEPKVMDPKPVKHVMGMRRIADKDYVAIKKAIMEHGAVYSTIFGESDTNEDNMINYTTSAQHYVGNKDQNHAVTIVGWDDNYPKENFLVRPKNNGAFIVMNSYGQDWGDKGYYYVSYEDLHIGTSVAYYTDIEANNNYDNIYTTDDHGPTNWLTFYNNKAVYANAYVPRGRETIEAVGLYNMNTNLSAEIYMIPDFKGPQSFLNSKPILLAKEKVVGRGYHRIKVPKSPAFMAKTAIVVKATTTDGLLTIPVEQPYADLNNAFIISDGEGYLYNNWEESNLDYIYDSETFSNSNIILKLYTNKAK